MSFRENVLDQHSPKIGSRRRARHRPTGWVRRAGLAGGVISAVALSAGAAPAQANGSAEPGPNETSQTLDLSQLRAAQATAQAAIDYELQAAEAQAAEDAAVAARRHKAADDAAKAAALRAAQARSAAQAASRSTERPALSLPVPGSGSVASVLGFLRAQVGKAYVMGATGPSAYDCSGLVQTAFRTIGVDLPRTSEEQSNTGTPVSLGSLQPGDLVFWGGQGSAYHVGVYIGGGQFLAAQNPSKGIVIEPMNYDEPDFATRVL